MAADVRGGVLVGLETLTLGVVRETAHGRVDVATCLEIHVGGVAIIAVAAPGVVQHSPIQ